MRLFLTTIALFFGFSVFAQDDWESDGEIEDVEIEIVKEKEITLPQANRNFKLIPPPNLVNPIVNLDYFFTARQFNVDPLDLKIRPLRIQDQPLEKTYGNYLKAGYGNFSTPMLEVYLNSKRNSDYSYGANFDYRQSGKGPVDDGNSANGRLGFGAYGKYFGDVATVSGDARYSSLNYRFYGYDQNADVNEETIKQRFNQFELNLAVENTEKESQFQYLLSGGLVNLADNFEAKETDVFVNGDFNYELNDDARIALTSDLSFINQQDSAFSSVSRNLFRFRPSVHFKAAGFTIEMGLNAVYENDTLGSADELHFYPVAKVTYPFSDKFNIYAGLGGDMLKRTLRSNILENPFLGSNQYVTHLNKSFELYGGIEGKLSSKVGFGAGISVANYKNMFYFLNDPEDQSKYNVVYDTGNTGLLNLNGELTYAVDQFKSSFRADVYAYTPDNFDKAYHKPNYKLTFVGSYNLFDKVLFHTEAYAIGGITALDTETLEDINLDAALDLNLKVDYLVSDQISIFLEGNNILGQEYELLNRYPVRGFQFMGGFTYSF